MLIERSPMSMTDRECDLTDRKLIGTLITDRDFDLTDRNCDFHTVYQRKSLAVSGDGQPIGGPFEGIWQVAAGKIGVEHASCGQVPGAPPSRG